MAENLFISWSGDTSRAVAEALRDWLPSVIQAVQPWISSADIEKGARWSAVISGKLKETKIGVICITPDNLEAPWVQFEAGALSKTVEDAYVCPYLFRVEPAAVKGPLAQFQLTKAEKDDTKRLLGTINNALGEGSLNEERLNTVFEKWWPDLEERLGAVPQAVGAAPAAPQRPDREILEEILNTIRNQAREQNRRRLMDRLTSSFTQGTFQPTARSYSPSGPWHFWNSLLISA